jgi:hypothetical protein
MKKAYVCQSCGSIYPADYADQWGRKYGHGLGSMPVCEALNSRYDLPVGVDLRYPENASHPVGVCKGVVILQDVDDKAEYNILAVDDPYMVKRAPIMQKIQLERSTALRLHLTTVANAKKATGEELNSILSALITK